MLSTLNEAHFKTLCLLAREMYQDLPAPDDLFIAEPSEPEIESIRAHCTHLDGKRGRSLDAHGNQLMKSIRKNSIKRKLTKEIYGRALELGLLAWKMAEIYNVSTPDDWETFIAEAREARRS